MRIALLYPPPWKVSAPGEPAPPEREGPPDGYKQGDLDADFYQIPYGLLSLGAQAIRAGHQVKVLNLSSFAWSKVEEVVGGLDAELFGLSCWTANRRGVALVARAIKKAHPNAHVVVGGPHATPLGPELLRHHADIDTVSLGESDDTFLELCDRLSRGEPTTAIPGTVYRDKGGIKTAASRKNIDELDRLASPQDYFATHILMTSRGCPWACTFCGAETSWGRGFRAQSIDYVLDAMERALTKLPVRMIQIKDDTFTTNKKRVLELCRKIRERKLNFLWSCDTRVDLLNEELLTEMRLAGCQRLSLGVETGSQKILDAIDKKITTGEILASTELAKKVGIKVRYYMMLGNRGETADTFRETLAFLERAQPHEYIFSCLSIYPGTRDFDDAEKAGFVHRKVYFEGTFQELKMPFDATDEDTAVMNEWFSKNSGLRSNPPPTSADYRAVLERLGDYHAAHLDLAGALYREGDLKGAEHHVRRALELDYPCPGIAYNYLACIAKARSDYEGMMEAFSTAAKVDPQHWVLIKNVNAAREWFKAGGPAKRLPLELEARHDFQLLERTAQPTLPGPLPEDWATWSAPLAPQPAAEPVKTPEMEGSKHQLGARGKLRVL